MKNVWKRILSVILTLVMVAGMMPANVWAADDVTVIETGNASTGTETVTVYFDNSVSQWNKLYVTYSTADSDGVNVVDMEDITSAGDTYTVTLPATATTVFFMNYAPGASEYVEGMQVTEELTVEAGKTYTYTAPAETETYEVATKAELDAAIASAEEGDTILLTANIEYATTNANDVLTIEKAITLDLGGYTLTTTNGWGGMKLKGGCSLKNGTLKHTGNTAAIKAWDVKSIEDVVIDVATYTEGKVKGGIVVQSGTDVCVGSIKNVTIKGDGLTNGIETYNCGNAANDVIGSMENVTIDANGTGMLISAPCGTATNCTINGDVSGIEIWIKGTYSATLTLVSCKVTGGTQAVYAHDEFSSDTTIQNNGKLSIVATDSTFSEPALTQTIARATDVAINLGLEDAVAENTTTNVIYTDLHTALTECKAGETVVLLSNVDLTGINWTPVGGWDGATQFLGEFDGKGYTISNLTINSTDVTADKYRGGLFANLGEGSSVHDLTIKNITITAANAGQYGALAGRSGASLTNIYVEGVTVTSVPGAYVGGVVGITNYYESGEYGFAWNNVDAKDVTIAFNGTGTNSYGGGLLGGMNPNGAKLNTYENCDVTNVTITSDDNGWHGGIWGWHGRSGAFKYVKNCSVTNVNITSNNASKASENRIGGICGFVGVSGGVIENVTVNGGKLIANDGYAAGFTPWSYAWGQDTFKNCTVTNVDVTCTNGVAAGFVAASGAGNQTTKAIDCSVVGGTVTGRIAGGFAGIDRVGNAGGAYVLDGCSTTATVYGTEIASGLIARVNSSNETVITGCTGAANVTGAEGAYVAGLVGYIGTSASNVVFGGNTYTVEPMYNPADSDKVIDAVAEVNGTYYESFTDAVAAANAIEGGATVELLADVTLGEKLTISGNVTISGEHTITRDDAYTGTLFAVNAGATLTLDGGLTIDGGNNYAFDSELYAADLADWENPTASADNAKWFTPEEGAPVATAYMITTSGNVNLNNVTIKNHYSTNGSGIVSASKGAVVTLTGAQITHNASTSGSGLVVNASAGVWSREEELITVTMNQGTVIDGNHVGGNHGIFKIYMGTYFTMNGGEIKNTTGWNSNGVAVGIYHGVFTMNGGTICSNSSEYGPNNGRNAAIYGHSNHLFTMNGGTICHNTGRSKAGIDSPYSETGYTGLTVINGGSVLDNTVLGTWSAPDVSGGATLTINGGTFTQDVFQWLAPDTGLVYDETTGTYTTTDKIYRLHLTDPATGEAPFVPYIEGNNLASLIETGKAFYADYYIMELEVLCDVKIVDTAVIDYPMTINLNGHTIQSTGDVFEVTNGATVTIEGDGTVKGGTSGVGSWTAVWANGGHVIINDGTYSVGGDSEATDTTHQNDVIYTKNGGTVVINGGTFLNDGTVWTLNENDANRGTITVKGGTFHNWNPANNVSEGEGTNFVAEGYKSEETETGIYTVSVKILATLTFDFLGETETYTYPGTGDGGRVIDSLQDLLTEYLIHSSVSFIGVPTNVVITLNEDIKLTEALVISTEGPYNEVPAYTITIDLNGHTIESTGDVFEVKSGATLTINGEGAVKGGTSGVGSWTAVWANGGNVVINGGTYSVGGDSTATDTTHQNDVIYTKNGGTVVINGGTFLNDGTVWTLNENDANRGTITVKGGTFHNWDPENNVSEGAGTNFCAWGYESTEAEGVYTVAKANVFEIWNVEDLYAFQAMANAGDNFSGKTVKLMADIDLGGKDWTPIASFAGNFVGNNYTISNFNIIANSKYSGFFGEIASSNGLEDVRVKDLILSNITASVGNVRFGALAGSVDGVVHNVTVKNLNVTTTHKDAWVGGMTAWMYWPWMTNCTVENMTVDATAGAEFVAGFACILQKNSNHVFDNLDVKGFKVTVSDTDGSCGVAGFVGQTQRGWENPKVINCDITGIDVTATGTVDVAGFIAWPGAHTIAENCTTEGKIDVTGVTSDACFAGGFFGNLGWNEDLGKMGHVVTDCSADVDITTKIAPAGGFIGSATNSNNKSMYATFTNCSASGDITAVEGGTADIGGFFGDGDRGVYNNCTASGTVTNNGTGYDGQFGGALYDVSPKYDYRYPAGTRDYLVDEITLDNCTATGTATSGKFIGNVEDGVQLTIKNYVAQIGETKYYSIQAAIDAAAAGDTVKLIADVTITETINVADDDKVTLDLNGHKITNAIATTATVFHTIKNSGELTVTDSVGGGSIESNANKGYVIYTEGGSLVVDGAKIVGINKGYAIVTWTAGDTITIEDGTAIEGRGALYVDGGATATVNGGTFTMTVQTDNNQDNVVYVGGTSELTINGGTFSTGNITGAQRIAIAALGTSKVTINGGTFYGLTGDIQSRTSAGNVVVNGGTFTGTKMDERTADSIALVGGTYSYDPTDWCAKGYKAVENNGTWTVVEDIVAEFTGEIVIYGPYTGTFKTPFNSSMTLEEMLESIKKSYSSIYKNIDITLLGNVDAGELVFDATVPVKLYGGEYKLNGTFTVADGTELVIHSGTYTFDVNEWVVEGKIAQNNGDGTWTVVDYVEWIKAQLLAGNSVKLEQDIVVDGSDIESISNAVNGNGQYPNYGIFNVYGHTVTFDLNGHSITYNGHADFACGVNDKFTGNSCTVAHGLFMANAGADLTIIDSVGTGTVTVYGLASGVYVCAPDTKATITGGTWINKGCATCNGTNLFLYASHGGELYITGGTFEQALDSEGKSYLITEHGGTASNAVIDFSKTKIEISGGTFIGMNPEEAVYIEQAGWGTQNFGTTNVVAVSYRAYDNGNGTWTVAEGKYTLTIDFNGGANDNGMTKEVAKDIPYGTVLTLPSLIQNGVATVVKEGYYCIGWSTDPNATEAEYNYGDTLTVTSDITIYAVWVKAVASVNDGTTVTYFHKLADAIDFAPAGSTVTLLSSITEDTQYLGQSVAIPVYKNLIIDLNGNTVTFNGFFIVNGKVEIKNGSLIGTSTSWSTVQTWTVKNSTDLKIQALLALYGAYVGEVDLTLTDVNVHGARHALRAEGGNVTINGGNYTIDAKGSTNYAINVGGDANSTVVIKNATASAASDASSTGGNAIKVETGSTLTIYGGNYSSGRSTVANVTGDLVLYGGTYTQDVQQWCAEGYYAADNGDGTWTVWNYVKWIKAQLLAGKDVTLEMDVTVTYDDVTTEPCTANGNGQYNNWGIFTVINGDVTFDLNGFDVTFDDHSDKFCNKIAFALFYANNGAKLTIVGDGNVTVNGMATAAYSTCVGSELTIKGGNWVNNVCKTCEACNIFLYASHGGALYIEDGTFAQNVEDSYLIVEHTGYVSNNDALVDYSKTVIEISGGTFIGMNPELAHSCNQVTWNKQEWGTTNVVAEGWYAVAVEGKENTWTIAEAVAVNVNTGKGYGDLSDALAAAKSGETVKLLQNTEETLLMVSAGVTLNLNGKYVTAANVLSFGDIIDNDGETDGLGGIVISNDRAKAYTQLQQNNSYLPLYDMDAGCYRFFAYNFSVLKYEVLSDSAVTFKFRLRLSTEEAYRLLADAVNSGVEISLQLAVDDGTKTTYINYVLSADKLAEYANDALEQIESGEKTAMTVNKTIRITLTGLDSLTSGTVIVATPTITSEVGMEFAKVVDGENAGSYTEYIVP